MCIIKEVDWSEDTGSAQFLLVLYQNSSIRILSKYIKKISKIQIFTNFTKSGDDGDDEK